MKRRRMPLLTAAAALFAGLCGSADAWTGSELLRMARSGEQGRMMAGAFAYGALGINQALGLVHESAPQLAPTSAVACPPREVSVEQLGEVALKFIRDNPRRQHEDAHLLVHESFIDAWPCRQ
jgi:hypothetical protein